VVDNGGNAPVGAERSVPWLLLRVLHDVDCLDRVLCAIGLFKLFQED
jgi:hypothetical protein